MSRSSGRSSRFKATLRGVRVAALVAALLVAAAAGVGAYAYVTGRPSAPDPRGLPITCESYRGACYQEGRRVDRPELGTQCEATDTERFLWGQLGADPPEAFIFVCAGFDVF